MPKSFDQRATVTVKVVDKDLGWEAIQSKLSSIRHKELRVGVLSSAGAHPSGATMAEIAAFQEFGTRSIPARPFLRTTLEENLAKYQRLAGRELSKALQPGGRTVKQVVNRLGLKIVADIQKKIVAIRTPPNAPSTIRQKGFDNPLIETGRLRQSINFEVK